MLKGFYALILVLGPFILPGIINRIKAIWAGRKGPAILQPLFDFNKLIRKGEVISKTTSFVFRIAPPVNVAAVLFASLIIPLPQHNAILSFPGDFILFAYSLALARFMLVIAALDTGSSFEGMGSAREITFSAIVEPAFFILVGSLALVTGHTSFAAIFELLNYSTGFTILVKSLCVISLFIMLLTECARVPVDDPNTHLELTMIHEVMILDYSGSDLAFMQYAVGLKMVTIATLLANLLIPTGTGTAAGLALYLVVLAIAAIAVGLVESWIARLRMTHVPQFIFLMAAFSLTAFAVVMFLIHGGF
ncbi:MAG TPA: NADH-quinone oxidoreductase subunit H [bacterium]|nr:NADH-quinone oxidoreductase subunit H [bacterium]HPN42967.1 NADH-quinone oxidoreductase subunit H [bacterium]